MASKIRASMKNTTRPLLLAVACALSWGTALAEKADRNKPMNIEADALRYDDLKQVSVFTGRAVLTKGTLGVLASLTLAATTEPHDLIAGLRRLRFPKALVDVIANMLRYLDVVTTELTRMRVALTSRGFTARNPRHWAVIARSLGALFVRAYERGERVYLAMASRGYAGAMPPLEPGHPHARSAWPAVAAPAVAAMVTAVVAWAVR
mgnify:CR=1 FL=1